MKKLLPVLILFAAFFGVREAAAASCLPEQIRWASSSNIVYVTGADAAFTLTELDKLLPHEGLTQVDAASKTWLLSSAIRLQQGATLNLHGAAVGGDASEVRLLSTSDKIVYIQANWGTIDIASAKILSWDEASGGPDTNHTDKRAYIQARSFLEGETPRESTMNINNSDVGYLGFAGAEAYGLSWKVNVADVSGYDNVDVFGDVMDSRIHHNYFGAYTYGAFGMTWKNNVIDTNVQYGLDPHDNSDQLVIEDNEFHHNGNHGLICSRFCDHLTIRNNKSHHNVGNGIMLHRATDESLVENNQVYSNSDSGIAVFDSHNNTIKNNKSWANKNGIRFSVGSSGNMMENNEFKDNTKYGIYFYKGSDVPLAGDGRPKNNTFIGNTIIGSGDYGLKLKEGDSNTFTNNTFSDGNRDAIVIEAAQQNTFTNNTLTGNLKNFYAPKNGAVGVSIQDTPIIPIKFASNSTSDVTVMNSNNAVYDNAKNIPTVAKNSGTSLALTPAVVGTSAVTFKALPLLVKPVSAGSLKALRKNWTTTKEWTINLLNPLPTPGMTVQYTVGELTPGAVYTVKKNAANLPPVTADSNGVLTFTDTATTTSTITYKVIPQ